MLYAVFMLTQYQNAGLKKGREIAQNLKNVYGTLKTSGEIENESRSSQRERENAGLQQLHVSA